MDINSGVYGPCSPNILPYLYLFYVVQICKHALSNQSLLDLSECIGLLMGSELGEALRVLGECERLLENTEVRGEIKGLKLGPIV